MRIGIFAKTFHRPTVGAVFEAVSNTGIKVVQFNWSCAGLAPFPDGIDGAACEQVREAAGRHGIEIAAVSGTFNMAHPDPSHRQDGLRRFRVLAQAAPRIRTKLITLCTGTRDPKDMWRRHPENDSPGAWADMLETIAAATQIAEEVGITIAFEPEVANVIDTAAKGRRLLDEVCSTHLRVVMDGANLFHRGELARQHRVLDEAFELLGNDIALAHAKDISEDGAAGHEAAGTGLLDYDYYLSRLARVGYDGPLVLHGLTEEQTPDAALFLRHKLACLDSSTSG